jgi:hypothetical protein
LQKLAARTFADWLRTTLRQRYVRWINRRLVRSCHFYGELLRSNLGIRAHPLRPSSGTRNDRSASASATVLTRVISCPGGEGAASRSLQHVDRYHGSGGL